MTVELLNSPLHAAHLAVGAKFAEFGGWNMPIAYKGGTIAEHQECRSGCAIFDVSHLGSVRVNGSEALEKLQRTFTNDLGRISPGKAQYSHMLNENGGVVDDVIIWWISESSFEIMPNASNTTRVVDALNAQSGDLEIAETTHDRAVIAVQGPQAREVLSKISAEAASVPRFCVENTQFANSSITVAGTGYTGEDGLEISVPLANALELWSLLVEAGGSPAGLGARDTLRLEAGLPLHGNELSPEITPIEANLKWVVSMDKKQFLGKEAIKRQIDNGVNKKLYGIATSGRRPPRSGQKVLDEGAEIGVITSGNYSPILGHGIAIALLPASYTIGDQLFISGRKSEEEAIIAPMPFYKP